VLAFGLPDIVHSHSLFTSYNYLFLREVFSIPFVTTFHGLVPNNVRMLGREKMSRVLRAGDAFLVNTRFARDQLLAIGCPREKIHIIPQGTNLEDFPFRARRIVSGEPIVVLSVGRLSIEKGFHIAIRAVARLRDSFPNIQYRIVGKGIYEKELKELVDTLGVQDCVSLCGLVDASELRRQYEEASIFVLPSTDPKDGSHTETQGVVLQEAQASGIPVIASRTGGIPEVISDRKTGLLFDEGDDEELAGRIEALIHDGELYGKISTQARQDVEENYSIEVIRDRVLEIYRRVLHQKQSD
jgi:colanic acid/amylovoran biosynthesis glycosyltransferase